MNSLFSSVVSSFDARSVNELAARIGEPSQTVTRSIEPIAATLLGGAASKSANSSWTGQLFSLVSSTPSEINISHLAAGGHASVGAAPLLDSGKKFLALLFDGNEASVTDALGKSTGLRASSIAPLLGLVAPVILSSLSRVTRERGLSQNALGSPLAGEGAGVKSMLPAGIASLFGVAASAAPPRPSAIGAVRETESPLAIGVIKEAPKGVSPWLWIIPALLIGGLLLWWFSRPKETVVATAPVVAAAPSLGEIITSKLPDNTDLKFPQNGVEGRLLAFIQDPNKVVDDNVWFDFDRLLFDTDSATLRPESQDQLANIAAIMKAYPNVHLKIGGYTDSTGDPQHNLKLSQERAEGVVQSLVALGVAPDRLEAQGYGQDHPVADNASEAGRAQNRRISMSVRQK